MNIYICVEHDENPADSSVHATFADLDLFLEEWNECMETTYSTLEEFNEGEEYRTIYASEFKTEER